MTNFASTVGLEPVSVALKFGFIAVLYLFVLWVVRSAVKDLRDSRKKEEPAAQQRYDDATGMMSASTHFPQKRLTPSQLRVVQTGSVFDLTQPILLGRGDEVTIQLEDPYASHRHAQIVPKGDVVILEDLGSTNGTYLNGEKIQGPQPLHVGDAITIGDYELTFEK